MANNIRYYITCDDDRPVVRTIPVAVRKVEESFDGRNSAETDSSPRGDSGSSTRVAKLVRSAVRRAPAAR